MLTPSEIQGMVERKYPVYLRSLVTGETMFPIRIRFGLPSTTDEFANLQKDVTTLATGNFGYTIEYETKNTRKYGTQNLPSQVRFDSEEQFIRALRKELEVEQFRANLAATMARLPQLKDWMASHIKWMVEFGHIWDDVLLVCEYFLANPRPGLYIRQLPIAVHTKFIQENSKVLSSLLSAILYDGTKEEGDAFEERFGLKPLEPMIRFRTLDPGLLGRLGVSHTEMGVTLGAFRRLPARGLRVVITENLMNFACLPDIPNGLAIWGQGNAAELLHKVQWLSDCDVQYWGDIDEHGFHILARLRTAFPAIKSLMMDIQTLHRFHRLAGRGASAGQSPTNLNQDEMDAYLEVSSQIIRLEQEKIPQSYVIHALIRESQRE